jgi:hypothetical protein
VDALFSALEAPVSASAPTPGATLLAFLLAFVLGQAIAWTYSRTHTGLSYSRSFTQSLVLMTLVVAMVMFVIGNSIVTAFGLLGALALIRFRNVLKDTRDTVFVLIALVIGMAVGTQRNGLAIGGTVGLLAVAAFLDLTAFGSTGRFDAYVTLRLADGREDGPEHLLRRFCTRIKRVSARRSSLERTSEVVYEVGLRDRTRGDEMVGLLLGVEGVLQASLLMRNEL